ncbi:MAG: TraR/DksA C4-type zinc finger protein [Verrucomicrobiota bacterium]|nr:TraR/DksA C4-type zinc finger protein [Verrucomicrobiota bacterium]
MAATKKTTSKKAASKKVTAKKSPAKKKAASKKSPAKKKAASKKGKKVAATSAAAILGLSSPKKAAKKTSSRANKPTGKIRIKPEWKKYYDILQDLRDRLTHQMDDLKKESAEEMSSYSMHMADSGTDNFDRDSALSLLSSDQDAVYEIDEALKRIEKKTYGVCELTGKNITKTRLSAVPWARYTVEAQAQLEKDGAVRQRNKLGSLGTIDGAGSSKTTVSESAETETKPTK